MRELSRDEVRRDRCGIREEVENGAVGVDGFAKLVVALLRLRTRDGDVEADRAKTVAYGVVDSEEAAHIEVSLGFDRDVIERDAERLSVQAENNNLARDERAEGNFHRARCEVIPGEPLRLVDVEHVLSGLEHRSDRPFALAGNGVSEFGSGGFRGDA